MRDDSSWIIDLMKQNYEAVGFIPAPTVQSRYIATGRYLLQRDERGKPIGYLLHGALRPGQVFVISQHCIDIEKRLRGYGERTFEGVVERARIANCRGIKLHCAADLESNSFWNAMGLQLVSVRPPANKRHRQVNVYVLDLWPSLWNCSSSQLDSTRFAG